MQPASAPIDMSSARTHRVAWAVFAGVLVALGLALRILAAAGDLWLDEIWSLRLAQEAGSLAGVLFGISHDNNHYLNSIWLLIVGSDAPVFMQRGLSVMMGAATVVAAGLVFPRDRAAQAMAMLLAAVAAVLVHYGSEARGYAGLLLFSFLALAATRRLIEGGSRHARIGLAAATGLGLLSHFTFAMTLGAAGLWMAVEAWRRSGSIRTAERETLVAFAPALLAAVGVGACFAAGALMNGFTIGGALPFGYDRFVNGYGGMVRTLLGMPSQAPPWVALALLATCVAAALLRPGLIDRRLAVLYIIGLVVLPGIMLLARLPTTAFSRYFLVSGVVLVVFLADAFAHAWRSGIVTRVIAGLAFAGILAGNILQVEATRGGRGRYSDAVAFMGREGPFSYGSLAEFRTDMTLRYHADRLGVEAAAIPREDWCANRPRWLIAESRLPADADGRASLSAPNCSLAVEFAAHFDSHAFSGLDWTVYRVVPTDSRSGG